MATYVAFLRAINLGAKRKFSPAQVRAAVESAGFEDVETHINTGNVRFSTTLRSRAKIEQALEDAFEADRGFEVPTIVYTTKELAQVARDAEEIGKGHAGRHYVSLLKDAPTAAAVKALDAKRAEGETCVVRHRAAHLLLGENYHTAKLTNAVVETHLGVATNRNVNVIRTLGEKWCG